MITIMMPRRRDKYGVREYDWGHATRQINKTIDSATPEDVKASRAKRVKQLREKIKHAEQQIKDATAEIEQWENL